MEEDQTLFFSGYGGSLLSCMVVATDFICHPEILIEQFWRETQGNFNFWKSYGRSMYSQGEKPQLSLQRDSGSEEDLFNIAADGNTETRNT